jgi:hypothetical protein
MNGVDLAREIPADYGKHLGQSYHPLAKIQTAQKHPSEAKAHRFKSSICGTTQVAPYQYLTFTTGCYGYNQSTKALLIPQCVENHIE